MPSPAGRGACGPLPAARRQSRQGGGSHSRRSTDRHPRWHSRIPGTPRASRNRRTRRTWGPSRFSDSQPLQRKNLARSAAMRRRSRPKVKSNSGKYSSSGFPEPCPVETTPTTAALPQLQRPPSRSGMSASRVRRDKAALSSGCKPHPANAPAGSNRSSHGGNKWLKPSV
jgi:hypothetical protein